MALVVRLGLAIQGDELEVVERPCIELDDEGKLAGLGSTCSSRRVADLGPSSVLLPVLCNAHIHVLDHAISESGEDLSISELVSHPNGLKYKLLSGKHIVELVAAVSSLRDLLIRDGVGVLGVYAELGDKGVRAILDGFRGLWVRLLPQPISTELSEMLRILEQYKGLGLDTVVKLETSSIDILRRRAREVYGHIHVHVSETRELYEAKDYEKALELKPNAVIHGVYLGVNEAEQLLSEGIGWVLCPRSNMFFVKALPPLKVAYRLWSKGYTLIAFGTDNAGWINPSIAVEMELSYYLLRKLDVGNSSTIARFILSSATTQCYQLLGLDYKGLMIGEKLYGLLAFIPSLFYTSNPLVTIVKRLSAAVRELVTGDVLQSRIKPLKIC